MEQLTEDGGVLKEVVQPGVGLLIPENCTIIFHYNAYVSDNESEPFDSSWLRNQPQRCSLEELMVPGLAVAVRSMRRGEQCRVVISPKYGFGDLGCRPRIPPHATLLYELTLLNFIEIESDGDMDGLEREDYRELPFNVVYEMCCRKHRNGNRFYDADEYASAARCYAAATKVLEWTQENADSMDRQRELLLKLYTNQAQCALRMRNAKLAVASARRALQLDPDSAKALYRCAVGLRMLGEFEEAAKLQRRAYALMPNSLPIERELCALNRVLFNQKQEVAQLCRDMMRALGTDGRACEERKANRRRLRLTTEQAVEPLTRHMIRKAVEALAAAEPGTELPFVDDFSKEELAYVQMLCDDLGLSCREVDGGLKAHQTALVRDNFGCT
ncbi:inactive peptidyl-prolyl cis-trans isomerase FKBP6-like [Dermacentor andersoni]|uniref:inactive peptidyl-prolyl cis-trans isomerase FKBP6-like n=1 Tax=Dermacentor andersoni TaxID=34620 RepID=UPI002155583F|nr:inactive peptidyl-prolyl cis-trans isomerase FKBP6-like [Dermacentor andersoni]